MTQSDLQKKLQDLYDEIERTETTNEEKQAILDDLKALIQKALTEPNGNHEQPLLGRLRNSLLEFGVEHPSLTTAMELVSEHLSALGI